jgi:hypothetical protein
VSIPSVDGSGNGANSGTGERGAESWGALHRDAGFYPEVVDYCQERELPVFPGVCTPTEIGAALEKGLTVLKFFSRGNPWVAFPFCRRSRLLFRTTSSFRRAGSMPECDELPATQASHRLRRILDGAAVMDRTRSV